MLSYSPVHIIFCKFATRSLSEHERAGNEYQLLLSLALDVTTQPILSNLDTKWIYLKCSLTIRFASSNAGSSSIFFGVFWSFLNTKESCPYYLQLKTLLPFPFLWSMFSFLQLNTVSHFPFFWMLVFHAYMNCCPYWMDTNTQECR